MVETLQEFLDSKNWRPIDLAYHSGITLNTVKNLLERKHRAFGNTIIQLDVVMIQEGLSESERLAVIRDASGANNA